MLPESLAGVPVTALGVALIRANESRRPDRLFDDPQAERFIEAAEPEFVGPGATPQATETWATLHRLAPAMAPRAVSVRYLQDYLLEAVTAGCDQVVELGAGLDTYALRLGWSRPCRYFEIDLPQLFAFKERVIGSEDASCDRRVVPADLGADWQRQLTAAGFDDGLRTAWLDGGVLDYLPRQRVHAIMAAIHAACVPGSQFGCILPAAMSDTVRAGVTAVTGSAATERPETGFGPGLADWLSARGWRVQTRPHADIAARYGRPLDDGASGGGYLSARLP